MGRNETRVIHRNEFSTASIVGAHDTHNPPLPTALEGATTILRNGEAAGVGSPARLPRGSAPLPWDTGQARPSLGLHITRALRGTHSL